jgi:hypothetical protein
LVAVLRSIQKARHVSKELKQVEACFPHTKEADKVIFLDHLRPFSARGFIREILFVSGERALLQDASIGRQIHFVE